MTPQDEACPDCYIAGSVSAFRDEHQALLAEVAQLRQDREQTEQFLRGRYQQILALEAARDHLRARLRELIATWQAEGRELLRCKDRDPMDPNLNFDETAGQLESCVADLLAVLTESPPQSIRENGPMNAIGPALDTKGETP